MPGNRLIVLKFGGSVLRDESTLRLAVHEIYRWRRRGWRVAAVVSAFAGRTDELLRRATGRPQADPCPNDPLLHNRCPQRPGTGLTHQNACDPWHAVTADPHATAALVATGELQSAGLLGLHLDRAGIRAAVLWPMSFDLVADGSPLDANPVSLCKATLDRALARHGVVVVPGYVAQDAEGRPVALGRGGSDLTALFIAKALEAEKCRLVKDVDGLYDRDPSLAVPLAACPPVPGSIGARAGRQSVSCTAGECPRRYTAATFADALATDGSIIQHKAVRFAQRSALAFELGRLNGTRPTRIGEERTIFGPLPPHRRRRVALLGLGTVGGGVLELLRQLGDDFEVTIAAVREPSRLRPGLPQLPPLTDDPIAAAESGVDLVIEAMGGRGAARAAVEAALRAGADVVTANKSLMACHGPALERLAQSHGRRIACSAAVGGSMPLLERLASLPAGSVRQVRAVINGTTNFILDQVSGGMEFDKALRLAQEYGYAETDPSNDLEGIDAAEKLCLAARALGCDLKPEEVERDVLSAATIASGLRSRYGGPLRHVASLEIGAGGVISAEVRLLQVGPEDPLARARDAGNAAVITLAGGGREVIEGKGAGRWPTAESVVADVLAIARQCAKAHPRGSAVRKDLTESPVFAPAEVGMRGLAGEVGIEAACVASS